MTITASDLAPKVASNGSDIRQGLVYRRPREGLSDNVRIRLTATERAIVAGVQDKIAATRHDGRRPTISLAVAAIIAAARIEDVSAPR